MSQATFSVPLSLSCPSPVSTSATNASGGIMLCLAGVWGRHSWPGGKGGVTVCKGGGRQGRYKACYKETWETIRREGGGE